MEGSINGGSDASRHCGRDGRPLALQF